MNLGKNKFFKMSLILSVVLELWYLWLTFCEYFKNDAWFENGTQAHSMIQLWKQFIQKPLHHKKQGYKKIVCHFAWLKRLVLIWKNLHFQSWE